MPSTFRSRSERSTMLKRPAISFGLVGSALYHPSCESFSKVISAPIRKTLARVLQGSQEMIACVVSLLQVFQRINGWVDGAPQLFFQGLSASRMSSREDGSDKPSGRCRWRLVVAAGYGTVDEGKVMREARGARAFFSSSEDSQRFASRARSSGKIGCSRLAW